MRWVALLLILGLGACKPDQPEGPANIPPIKAPQAEADPLAPLRHGYEKVLGALGPHEMTFEAKYQVSVKGQPAGSAGKGLTVHARLLSDASSNVRGRKWIGAQHGREVVFVGGKLFVKLRHSKFTRREATRREALPLLNSIYGFLPGYADQFAPWLTLSGGTPGKLLGRDVVVHAISKAAPKVENKRDKAKHAENGWAARAVHHAEGQVQVDKATGVVLAAKLDLEFTAPAPKGLDPQTGLARPGADDGPLTLVKVQFIQKTARIGAGVPAVGPPPTDQVVDVERRRLVEEKQMVLGEKDLVPLGSPAGGR